MSHADSTHLARAQRASIAQSTQPVSNTSPASPAAGCRAENVDWDQIGDIRLSARFLPTEQQCAAYCQTTSGCNAAAYAVSIGYCYPKNVPTSPPPVIFRQDVNLLIPEGSNLSCGAHHAPIPNPPSLRAKKTDSQQEARNHQSDRECATNIPLVALIQAGLILNLTRAAHSALGAKSASPSSSPPCHCYDKSWCLQGYRYPSRSGMHAVCVAMCLCAWGHSLAVLTYTYIRVRACR